MSKSEGIASKGTSQTPSWLSVSLFAYPDATSRWVLGQLVFVCPAASQHTSGFVLGLEHAWGHLFLVSLSLLARLCSRAARVAPSIVSNDCVSAFSDTWRELLGHEFYFADPWLTRRKCEKPPVMSFVPSIASILGFFVLIIISGLAMRDSIGGQKTVLIQILTRVTCRKFEFCHRGWRAS